MRPWHKKDSEGIDLPYRAAGRRGNDRKGIHTWKQNNKGYIKAISVFIAFVFFFQQIVYAQSQEAVWNGSRVVDVPYDIADKTDQYYNGGKELIIHIQDAHASLSAQYSIVDLLDDLSKNYELDFVALEGAEGYIDTSMLGTMPDKEIRRSTADILMREGRMSAGEFFAVTSDRKSLSVYGVEDNDLYRKNLDSFRDVAASRATVLSLVRKFKEQIQGLEKKVYSDELLSFAKKSRAHRRGEMSFSGYWKYVNALPSGLKIKGREYTELNRLMKAIGLEKKIDFSKANKERKALISVLSERLDKNELEGLILRSVDFKQNKVSQPAFHQYLAALAARNGVRLSEYEQLSMFIEYVSVYEKLDIFELYRQMSMYEKEMLDDLYLNNEEKMLYELYQLTDLLGRLYSMELTNDGFDQLQSKKNKINARYFAAVIKDLCRKHGISVSGDHDLNKMLSGLDDAVEFYGVAESRNKAMINNTLRYMREEGSRVAALITGGYHTRGLKNIMKTDGLSYLVIAPKFEEGKERPYIAILTNKKNPYEKLLDSGQYQLAVEAYFYNNRLSKLIEIGGLAIGEKRCRLGDKVSLEKAGKEIDGIREMWIDAYASSYESKRSDPVTWEAINGIAEPITPEKFREEMKRITVDLRENGDVAVFYDGHGLLIVTQEEGVFKKKAYSGKKERAPDTAAVKGAVKLDLGLKMFTEMKKEDPAHDALSGKHIPYVLSRLKEASEFNPSDEDILGLLKAKGFPAKYLKDVGGRPFWTHHPQIREVASDFITSVRSRIISHKKVNDLIKASLPTVLSQAGTREERMAALEQYFEVAISEKYNVSAYLIPIDGLHASLGLKAHAGISSVYGTPVVYIDAAIYDGDPDEKLNVIGHELYELGECRKNGITREWIRANMAAARNFAENIHRENPHKVSDHGVNSLWFIYEDLRDVVLAAKDGPYELSRSEVEAYFDEVTGLVDECYKNVSSIGERSSYSLALSKLMERLGKIRSAGATDDFFIGVGRYFYQSYLNAVISATKDMDAKRISTPDGMHRLKMIASLVYDTRSMDVGGQSGYKFTGLNYPDDVPELSLLIHRALHFLIEYLGSSHVLEMVSAEWDENEIYYIASTTGIGPIDVKLRKWGLRKKSPDEVKEEILGLLEGYEEPLIQAVADTEGIMPPFSTYADYLGEGLGANRALGTKEPSGLSGPGSRRFVLSRKEPPRQVPPKSPVEQRPAGTVKDGESTIILTPEERPRPGAGRENAEKAFRSKVAEAMGLVMTLRNEGFVLESVDMLENRCNMWNREIGRFKAEGRDQPEVYNNGVKEIDEFIEKVNSEVESENQKAAEFAGMKSKFYRVHSDLGSKIEEAEGVGVNRQRIQAHQKIMKDLFDQVSVLDARGELSLDVLQGALKSFERSITSLNRDIAEASTTTLRGRPPEDANKRKADRAGTIMEQVNGKLAAYELVEARGMVVQARELLKDNPEASGDLIELADNMLEQIDRNLSTIKNNLDQAKENFKGGYLEASEKSVRLALEFKPDDQEALRLLEQVTTAIKEREAARQERVAEFHNKVNWEIKAIAIAGDKEEVERKKDEIERSIQGNQDLTEDEKNNLILDLQRAVDGRMKSLEELEKDSLRDAVKIFSEAISDLGRELSRVNKAVNVYEGLLPDMEGQLRESGHSLEGHLKGYRRIPKDKWDSAIYGDASSAIREAVAGSKKLRKSFEAKAGKLKAARHALSMRDISEAKEHLKGYSSDDPDLEGVFGEISLQERQRDEEEKEEDIRSVMESLRRDMEIAFKRAENDDEVEVEQILFQEKIDSSPVLRGTDEKDDLSKELREMAEKKKEEIKTKAREDLERRRLELEKKKTPEKPIKKEKDEKEKLSSEKPREKKVPAEKEEPKKEKPKKEKPAEVRDKPVDKGPDKAAAPLEAGKKDMFVSPEPYEDKVYADGSALTDSFVKMIDNGREVEEIKKDIFRGLKEFLALHGFGPRSAVGSESDLFVEVYSKALVAISKQGQKNNGGVLVIPSDYPKVEAYADKWMMLLGSLGVVSGYVNEGDKAGKRGYVFDRREKTVIRNGAGRIYREAAVVFGTVKTLVSQGNEEKKAVEASERNFTGREWETIFDRQQISAALKVLKPFISGQADLKKERRSDKMSGIIRIFSGMIMGGAMFWGLTAFSALKSPYPAAFALTLSILMIRDGISKMSGRQDKGKKDEYRYEKLLFIKGDLYEEMLRSLDLTALAKSSGIDSFVKLEASGDEEVVAEMKRSIQGRMAVAALLDIKELPYRPDNGRVDLDKLENIISDFARSAETDIINLMHPELSNMNKKMLENVRDLEKKRQIANLMACVIPEGESRELAGKGLYQIRVDNIYKTNRIDYSPRAVRYMVNMASKADKDMKEKYFVTTCDNAMDLRLLGNAIRERRRTIGVNESGVDPVEDIVVIRRKPGGSLDKAIEKHGESRAVALALKNTGLEGIVSPDSVVILEEGGSLSLGEISQIATDRGARGIGQVAISDKARIVNTSEKDQYLRADSRESMVLVTLENEKKSLVSQLYRMTIEIAAHGNKTPDFNFSGKLRRAERSKYNMFIYLPEMSRIDIEAEAGAYEQYMEDVLTQA